MRVLGLIPARGGSKGVPRKNIRLLDGKPLLYYTVEAAKASRFLTHTILNTDSDEIAHVGRELGVEVPFLRPPELARDDTPTVLVMLDTLERLKQMGETYDYIVLLQPTSPLRAGEDIDNCIDLLAQHEATSVVSVSEVPAHFHPDWQFLATDKGSVKLYNGLEIGTLIPRRQLLSKTYARNGAVYINKIDVLIKNAKLLNNDTILYIMPNERSINIDDEVDFLIAESIIKHNSTLGDNE